jgi:uncharacterized membrane protein
MPTEEMIQKILEIVYNYKGRILGTLIGFLFSLFFIYFGFILTVFIFVSILGGYYIGKRYDQQEDFRDIIDDILPPNK